MSETKSKKAKPEAAPPAPEAAKAKPNLAAFLSATAKKPAKGKASHMEYDGDAKDLASDFLKWAAAVDEAKREKDVVRDQIIKIVSPWHAEKCRARGEHEATVVVPANQGAVRVSFQHRYAKLSADKAELLAGILGETAFTELFRQVHTIAIRKEIAEDPAKLEEMHASLVEVIGAERMEAWFETSSSLVPNAVFTERKYTFDPATSQKLEAAGVKQVVAMAKSA